MHVNWEPLKSSPLFTLPLFLLGAASSIFDEWDIGGKLAEMWFRHGPFAVLAGILLAVFLGWLPSTLSQDDRTILENQQTVLREIQQLNAHMVEESTILSSERTQDLQTRQQAMHILRMVCAHASKNPQQEEECINAP